MSSANPSKSMSFEDKDFSNFSQPLDNQFNDLFHQWLSHDQDSSESSNISTESNLFEDLDQGPVVKDWSLFESSISKTSTPQHQPSHSWRASTWHHHKPTPIPQSQKLVHHQRSDGPVISGTELLSLEGKLRSSDPVTTAATWPSQAPRAVPVLRRTKTTPTNLVTKGVHKSLSRDRIVSPNMMRPSYYAKNEPTAVYEWTERFERFSLQVPPPNQPLSPPPSAKRSHLGRHSVRTEVPEPVASILPVAFEQYIPQTPRESYHLSNQDAYYSNMQASHESSTWTPTTDLNFPTVHNEVHSEPSSSFIHPSQVYNTDFALDTHGGQDFSVLSSNLGTQDLIESLDGLLPATVTEQNQFFTSLASPFQHHSQPAIIDDDEDDISSDVSPTTSLLVARQLLPVDPVPTPPLSRSPSPPSSPPTTPHRRTRRRPKLTPRKSLSSNALKSPKTPKTPTLSSPNSSSGGSGGLGFVNFTPDDSQKILTGVAPSGSSKTKARRDKEANDKRRRLSEAAKKAIEAAGGDLEWLKREGLS